MSARQRLPDVSIDIPNCSPTSLSADYGFGRCSDMQARWYASEMLCKIGQYLLHRGVYNVKSLRFGLTVACSCRLWMGLAQTQPRSYLLCLQPQHQATSPYTTINTASSTSILTDSRPRWAGQRPCRRLSEQRSVSSPHSINSKSFDLMST